MTGHHWVLLRWDTVHDCIQLGGRCSVMVRTLPVNYGLEHSLAWHLGSARRYRISRSFLPMLWGRAGRACPFGGGVCGGAAAAHPTSPRILVTLSFYSKSLGNASLRTFMDFLIPVSGSIVKSSISRTTGPV